MNTQKPVHGRDTSSDIQHTKTTDIPDVRMFPDWKVEDGDVVMVEAVASIVGCYVIKLVNIEGSSIGYLKRFPQRREEAERLALLWGRALKVPVHLR